MTPSKTLAQVFVITNPDRIKLPISLKQSVLKIYFFSAEKGGGGGEGADYRAENMTKIKFARVLLTSFHNFGQLQSLHFWFLFCCVII